MSERFNPVISAEEWASVPRELTSGYDDALYSLCSPGITADGLLEIIARANALLPDTEPRKIRREFAQELRDSAVCARSQFGPYQIDPDAAEFIADVLESYLPPTA